MKLRNNVFKGSILILCMFLMFGTSYAENVKSTSNTDYREVDEDKEWKITFTGIIDLTSVNGSNIYITNSRNEKIESVELEFIDGNSIVVRNGEDYLPGELYTLHIRKSIVNIEGEPLDEDKNLYFKVKGNEYAVFRVSDVEFLDRKSIIVEFTEDIDKRAEVPLFYEIQNSDGDILKGSYEDMEIEMLNDVKNVVLIKVINSRFDMDERVMIKVSGELKSVQDTRFNGGESDWIIVDKKMNGEGFKVEEVELLGDKVLRVKFNRKISSYDADKELNFKVFDEYDRVVPIDESKYYGSNEVRLNLDNKIQEFGIYTLQVKKMRDFTDTLTIKNKRFEFNIDEIKETRIQYTTKTLDKRTVELKFEEKLDKNTALKTSNYILELKGDSNKGQIPKRIYFDEITGDRVKLFFYTDLMYSKGYNLRVMRYLENNFGDMYDADSIRFVSPSKAEYDFDVEDVRREEKYVEIEFSSEVVELPSLMEKDNYDLILNEGGGRQVNIDCNGVKMIDGKTLRLQFEGMRNDEEYTLFLPTVEGYFGERLKFESGIDISR